MDYLERRRKIRSHRLTILLNKAELETVEMLADAMNRSRSDAVREVIRQAIQKQQLEAQRSRLIAIKREAETK